MEAIHSGKDIDKLFIQNGLKGELFFELWKEVKERKIPFQYVPPEKLNRLTNNNHQGIVAFLSFVTYQRLDDILPEVFESGKVPLVIVLDRITDVRNLGAIARTAECAGADAIVVPEKGSAQMNADAVKTSAGALHHIPVCREPNLKFTLDVLKEYGFQVVAATEKADKLYYSADYSLPTALLLGSEEDGISHEYLKKADLQVKIPLLGEIASLNVSVAAGILLYEVVKQRSNLSK
ncbi:MAG: 23S rRNA (guanosine(2251)-2'-O)-methyltransferase RlmB [Lentimicrobiaceae bacterium]|nr:23S rRNA (guanosine(2251)-2'-O)-methyltransferase RlmB [Lentimicrobiaceae bacterium]